MYSEEEITSNVPFGYLSVMLCNLCLYAQARSQVEARLPGQSLIPLLDAVAEFLRYHKAIDKAMNDEAILDGKVGFVDRVQTLLNEFTR